MDKNEIIIRYEYDIEKFTYDQTLEVTLNLICGNEIENKKEWFNNLSKNDKDIIEKYRKVFAKYMNEIGCYYWEKELEKDKYKAMDKGNNNG